jgi:hypothetical protein
MTERQLQRLLDNRPRYEAAPLVDAEVLRRLLRTGARASRRREEAESAWRCVAPARLAAAAQVQGFERGVLELRVQESAAASELRLLCPVIQRRLAGLLPGLRAVRVVAGPAGEHSLE